MSELSEKTPQVGLWCCTSRLGAHLPLTAALTNRAIQPSSPGQPHPKDAAAGGGSTPGPCFTLTARGLLRRLHCALIASTSTWTFPDRLHAVSVIWRKWGIEPYVWSEERSPSSGKEKVAKGHVVYGGSGFLRWHAVPYGILWRTAPSDNQAIWWQEFICPSWSKISAININFFNILVLP